MTDWIERDAREYSDRYVEICEAYAMGDLDGLFELARRALRAEADYQVCLRILRHEPEACPERVFALAFGEGTGIA